MCAVRAQYRKFCFATLKIAHGVIKAGQRTLNTRAKQTHIRTHKAVPAFGL